MAAWVRRYNSTMSHEFLQLVSYQGGRDGRGTVTIDGGTVNFSMPASLGGLGAGSNPEELLLAAMGACYSLTLGIITAKSQPSIERVAARMEGTVIEVTEPKRGLRFSEIRITPVIHLKPGAPAPDAAALKAACEKAEAACFITQTVKPGVDSIVLDPPVLHEA